MTTERVGFGRRVADGNCDRAPAQLRCHRLQRLTERRNRALGQSFHLRHPIRAAGPLPALRTMCLTASAAVPGRDNEVGRRPTHEPNNGGTSRPAHHMVVRRRTVAPPFLLPSPVRHRAVTVPPVGPIER